MRSDALADRRDALSSPDAHGRYVFSVFFRTVNHGKIKVSVRLTVLVNVLVNVFVPEKQASPDFRVFKSSQKKTFLVRETC